MAESWRDRLAVKAVRVLLRVTVYSLLLLISGLLWLLDSDEDDDSCDT